MPEKLFLDTNVLLDYVEDFQDFYISSKTLQELENITTSSHKDEYIKYKARRALRYLDNNPNIYSVIVVTTKHYDIVSKFDLEYINDYLIIACVYDLIQQGENVVLVTNDISCRVIAEQNFEVPAVGYQPSVDRYKGWRRIAIPESRYIDFINSDSIEDYGLYPNEYVIIDLINAKGQIVSTEIWQWDGEYFSSFRTKNISNGFNGQIEPLDIYQKAFFHMLQSDSSPIKITNSIYGAGKTFLMLNWALQELEKNSNRVLYFIKPDNPPAGRKIFPAIPGGVEEKCEPLLGVLGDMTGASGIYDLLDLQPRIKVLPIQFVKGRNLEDAIVFLNEAQDFTSKEMERILSRLSVNSVALIDGSTDQIDNPRCLRQSGLEAVIDNLKDEKIASQVNLVNDYRGSVSKILSSKKW